MGAMASIEIPEALRMSGHSHWPEIHVGIVKKCVFVGNTFLLECNSSFFTADRHLMLDPLSVGIPACQDLASLFS